MKNKIFAIFGAIIVIALLVLSNSLVEDADKSKNYVCQMPITGEYAVWTEGGLQMQWFGDIDAYAKTSQIEFSDLEKNQTGYVAVGPNPAAGTTFNDRGKGYIVGSFRVVLPTDEQNMMEIQRDFGSEEALINNLVRPTLYKVVTACGPLMSSLESVSETRTDLTAYITDQLNNGVYKTKTSKVEAINEITGEKELRTQAELIADENAPGGYARQEKSPFSQYGITAGIVSIIDIKYDAATQQQIDAQKAANLSVITAKTQALEAQQKAITIEEQGKARAAEAKWAQEQEKAVAVTKAEQEREVARLAAEKAEFEKKKIIAQGQAEAEANRLKVNAGLTPQERAEWDYKTAVGIAQALANSKVSWVPTIMMDGSGHGNTSAMDAVGFNMMLDVVKKMNEN
jgi:regulator of protease activity HflC (stomatin/prohibitin superfamily)